MVTLFSLAEYKWTQTRLRNNSGSCDRRQGLLYWNFQSEYDTWKGGTH